jgi:F0F1-type ATP synthase assembly protein I
MPAESDPSIGWSTLLSMGAVIAAQLVAGLALGWLIDSLAGTTPIFLLIGVLLGVVGAVSYTVVEFRKYLKN